MNQKSGTDTRKKFDFTLIERFIRPDCDIIQRAKKRQAAVWRKETPDQWPIHIGAPLTEEQASFPSADIQEAFNDKDAMLFSQLRMTLGVINSKSDAVPSIRVNFGTAVLLSCFGLEQQIFPDKMPWLKDHLSKQEIADIQPEDISFKGSFARALEMMTYMQEKIGDRIPVYCLDTQGPFDLAHLLFGDDIFLALYDDPDFVHHLLKICTTLNIKAHEAMKTINGERPNQQYHGNGLYAETMGVRICEDTTVMLSPEMIEIFSVPYIQKVADHFGGAWVHYCGRNDHLTESICAIPSVRGINFGHIPGKEYDHPFSQDMERCLKTGKVYFGNWPRFPKESGKAYLERMFSYSRQGCLIPNTNAAIDGETIHCSDDALTFWQTLHRAA